MYTPLALLRTPDNASKGQIRSGSLSGLLSAPDLAKTSLATKPVISRNALKFEPDKRACMHVGLRVDLVLYHEIGHALQIRLRGVLINTESN